MIEKYKHGKVTEIIEVKTLILLQVNALSKLYGAETILSNIKLEVQTKRSYRISRTKWRWKIYIIKNNSG